MARTERPATEWIFDDLGKMRFVRAYDFTSAEFDGVDIGIVWAVTESAADPLDHEKRFQMRMPKELAAALVEALQDHLASLG